MTEPFTIFAPFHCPIARSLTVIGDRWTILILRDLVRLGPRKFQDFERSLNGISPNTLSVRLKRLEEAGVVERRCYEQHPPRERRIFLILGEGGGCERKRCAEGDGEAHGDLAERTEGRRREAAR